MIYFHGEYDLRKETILRNNTERRYKIGVLQKKGIDGSSKIVHL